MQWLSEMSQFHVLVSEQNDNWRAQLDARKLRFKTPIGVASLTAADVYWVNQSRTADARTFQADNTLGLNGDSDTFVRVSKDDVILEKFNAGGHRTTFSPSLWSMKKYNVSHTPTSTNFDEVTFDFDTLKDIYTMFTDDQKFGLDTNSNTFTFNDRTRIMIGQIMHRSGRFQSELKATELKVDTHRNGPSSENGVTIPKHVVTVKGDGITLRKQEYGQTAVDLTFTFEDLEFLHTLKTSNILNRLTALEAGGN